MTRKDCLDRQTLRAVAAGRCPKERLAAVQRHLARCSRCRAAVVSAAAGVRGPGETVVLKRPSRVVGRISKALLVVASVAAVGAAWRYTVVSKPESTAAVPLQAQSVPAMPLVEDEQALTVTSSGTPSLFAQDPVAERPLDRLVAPPAGAKTRAYVDKSTSQRPRRPRTAGSPTPAPVEARSQRGAPARVTTMSGVTGDRVIRTTLE
jgi:hypothetical protein